MLFEITEFFIKSESEAEISNKFPEKNRNDIFLKNNTHLTVEYMNIIKDYKICRKN